MTFVDNLGAFLKVTGVEQAHYAWAFASVPWESDAQRDSFIQALQAPGVNG